MRVQPGSASDLSGVRARTFDVRSLAETPFDELLAAQNEADASEAGDVAQVASLGGVARGAGSVIRAALPDAIVLGGTGHFGNGIFLLVNPLTGSGTYFEKQDLFQRGDGPKFGTVGTGTISGLYDVRNGPRLSSLEYGIGMSWGFKLPGNTDAVAFVNGRAGLDLEAYMQEQGEGSLSLNGGIMVSARDLAKTGLATAWPPLATAFTIAGAALDNVTGLDGYLGVAWRLSLNFEGGRPVSVTIGGETAELPRLGDLFGGDPQPGPPPIPESAAPIARLLSNAWQFNGQSWQDAASWINQIHADGGNANLGDKAVEVLANKVLTTANGAVTAGSFLGLGMDEATARDAMLAYSQLRDPNRAAGQLDVRDAWTRVWEVYVKGVDVASDRGSSAGNAGLEYGGEAGGRAALAQYEYLLRSDPNAI